MLRLDLYLNPLKIHISLFDFDSVRDNFCVQSKCSSFIKIKTSNRPEKDPGKTQGSYNLVFYPSGRI